MYFRSQACRGIGLALLGEDKTRAMYNACIHQTNKLVKGKFNQQYFGHLISFLVELFCFLNSPKLFQIEVLKNSNLRFM